MNRYLFLLILIWLNSAVHAQNESVENTFALCIAAPRADRLDEFVAFINEEVGPKGINTLILRVDFNYAFQSYPNLRDDDPLTDADIKKIVLVAKKHDIELIPQINLLGHQSWAETTYALLRTYPEFDETPHIAMPEEYVWPNKDGLYCRSYCPLHPGVHEVVFALIDEIVDVFESRSFHAGMDEVFYLGDSLCVRCSGKEKASLFAGEVTRIRDHLADNDITLWIWGDRLIDAETSGLGIWEASGNETAAAIHLIPKDVIVNDWHYNDAVPTPAYFATNGLSVVSCFWNKPEVARSHMEMMRFLKETSPTPMNQRLLGTMQTVWCSADQFLDVFYGKAEIEGVDGQVESYRAMVKWINEN